MNKEPTSPASDETPCSPLTFDDAVKMARGSFDYSGGHRDRDLEIYHHGIQTVLNVLEAAQKRGFDDMQVRVVHSIGANVKGETRSAAELSPPPCSPSF